MPLYIVEKGNQKGQTIVFIHGGGMSGWMWKKQWEAFQDFHCLIPDLPDHGNSITEGNIDINDSAERIAALIRQRANNGRAHVVGHSLGGKIIVELLSRYPEVIDHAVVGSALFRPMPLLNLSMNMPFYKLSVWMLKNKAFLEMQARQFKFPDQTYIEDFKKEATATTPEMLDRIFFQLNKFVKLPAGLDKAQVPTLVLAGNKEPRAMRLSAADIAQAIPNAKAYYIQGALHNYPWVQHEAFNYAIRAWLDGKPIDHPEIGAIP